MHCGAAGIDTSNHNGHSNARHSNPRASWSGFRSVLSCTTSRFLDNTHTADGYVDSRRSESAACSLESGQPSERGCERHEENTRHTTFSSNPKKHSGPESKDVVNTAQRTQKIPAIRPPQGTLGGRWSSPRHARRDPFCVISACNRLASAKKIPGLPECTADF